MSDNTQEDEPRRDPDGKFTKVTEAERLVAAATAGVPAVHAARLRGSSLEEITEDAKALAADLASSTHADGEQSGPGGAKKPWLNEILGAGRQPAAAETETPPATGGSFDGSNSAGGGDNRPPVSGSKAVDAHIRRVVIGY